MGVQLTELAGCKGLPGLATAVRPPVDSVVSSLATEDEVLLRRLLTEPIEYIDDPSFEKRGTER